MEKISLTDRVKNDEELHIQGAKEHPTYIGKKEG
jgi:hypothetical protein